MSNLELSYYVNWILKKMINECIQLNEYETDPYFLQSSHHLTWYCSSISEDLHRFARNLQHLLPKLFLLLFLNYRNNKKKTILWAKRNNSKNNFASKCCKFLANLQKSWNNMMSNNGLIIENINLTHIHLAVNNQSYTIN